MTLRKARITIAGIVVACGLAAFAALPASADFVSFNLDTGNSALSGYSGPFGTVEVGWSGTGTSNTATVTFTALTSGIYQFSFTDSGLADVNTNGKATASSFGGTPLFTGGTVSVSGTGAGEVDGFGKFNQTTENFDGFTDSLLTVTYTLTKSTGTWVDAANVLAENSKNALAAAHIAVSLVGGTTDTPALTSGYVAGNISGDKIPPSAVPEASTLVLLGIGGLPLLALRRRRG